MTGDPLERIADRVESAEVPAAPTMDELRTRAHRRSVRRNRVRGGVVVAVLGVAVVAASLTTAPDQRVETAAPPGYETEAVGSTPSSASWEWRSVPSMLSRTGEPVGYGVRPVTGSNDVLVYLDDGGVCVDAASCDEARDSYGPRRLQADYVDIDTGALRSIVGSGAPFEGWNVVVVPGVTGDFQLGSRAEADVPGGPSAQHFVGADNLDIVLRQLVDPSSELDADRVIVMGSGTSSLGVLFGLPRIADRLDERLAGVVVEGGVLPTGPSALRGCVAQRWGEVIGLSLPDDWEQRVGSTGPGTLSSVYAYVADRFTDVPFVLVTSRADQRARKTLRAGVDNCDRALPVVTPDRFASGVTETEAQLDALPEWSTVVVDGDGPAPLSASDDLETLDPSGELRSVLEGLTRT